MPNINLIGKYQKTFSEVDVKFFRCSQLANACFEFFFSSRKIADILKYFDARFLLRSSGF